MFAESSQQCSKRRQRCDCLGRLQNRWNGRSSRMSPKAAEMYQGTPDRTSTVACIPAGISQAEACKACSEEAVDIALDQHPVRECPAARHQHHTRAAHTCRCIRCAQLYGEALHHSRTFVCFVLWRFAQPTSRSTLNIHMSLLCHIQTRHGAFNKVRLHGYKQRAELSQITQPCVES